VQAEDKSKYKLAFIMALLRRCLYYRNIKVSKELINRFITFFFEDERNVQKKSRAIFTDGTAQTSTQKMN